MPESHDFSSVFRAGCNHSFQISGLRSTVGWCVVKFYMVSFALCSLLTTKSDFVTCPLCKWHAYRRKIKCRNSLLYQEATQLADAFDLSVEMLDNIIAGTQELTIRSYNM